jgi:hypothetical protein
MLNIKIWVITDFEQYPPFIISVFMFDPLEFTQVTIVTCCIPTIESYQIFGVILVSGLCKCGEDAISIDSRKTRNPHKTVMNSQALPDRPVLTTASSWN